VSGLLLGVDGGNTKSIAIVADATGQIAGLARAGCGDIYRESPEAALSELGHAVDGALDSAGASRADIGCAAFSVAGADWAEDYRLLRAEMTTQFQGLRELVIVNDAIGALRAGTPDGVGVSVVCGTGSAIGAKSAEGNCWHSSFWGEDLGAVTMGQRALRAIVQSELELAPATSLTSRALNGMGVASVEELLHVVTRRESRAWLALARFAPWVLDAAEQGDEIATRIVDEIGRGLAAYARVAARKVGLSTSGLSVVCAGGCFRHRSAALRNAITTGVPGAHVVEPEFEPAVGALLLAFDAVGLSADLRALRASLPPPAYFAGDAAVQDVSRPTSSKAIA
jgi:N-acetylglucosamine kinase-like BadF-type ATPase